MARISTSAATYSKIEIAKPSPQPKMEISVILLLLLLLRLLTEDGWTVVLHIPNGNTIPSAVNDPGRRLPH